LQERPLRLRSLQHEWFKKLHSQSSYCVQQKANVSPIWV